MLDAFKLLKMAGEPYKPESPGTPLLSISCVESTRANRQRCQFWQPRQVPWHSYGTALAQIAFFSQVDLLPRCPSSGQVEPDTVHFSSKVSELFASQRICVSLWLCGGFYFFRLGATPLGTVPSNFRMSPFFPMAQPRCASAKPIASVCASFICSQFFPRSIE